MVQRGESVRALVTGGAGFIGSHLAKGLLDAGQTVRVLDNLLTGKRGNVPDTEFIEGDIRDGETVRNAVKGVDVVYHLAALASVPRSVADPLPTNDINVKGTYQILTKARRAGVRRVVFASSSSIYGDSETLPKREDHPVNPLSPYAVSKVAGESACRAFTSAFGLETVSLRFFNVYGPRQDPDSPYAAVIPIFLSRLRDEKDLPVFGDGKQTRDFTFVEDVVRGIMLAADAPGASGGTFNLSGGSPVSVLDLAAAAGRVMEKKVELRFEPPRAGDILHSYGDGARARETFGFEVGTKLEDGLRRTA